MPWVYVRGITGLLTVLQVIPSQMVKAWRSAMSGNDIARV